MLPAALTPSAPPRAGKRLCHQLAWLLLVGRLQGEHLPAIRLPFTLVPSSEPLTHGAAGTQGSPLAVGPWRGRTRKGSGLGCEL